MHSVPQESFDHLAHAWAHNPFASDAARANSSYAAFDGTDLVHLLETSETSAFASVAHASLRSWILDDAFSCLAARSAFARRTYRFGAYRRLDDAAVTEGLARDLYAFVTERRRFGNSFNTFVAVFGEYERRDTAPELGFERALWGQLGRLHDLDRVHHTWDPAVSADPNDKTFSYSFGGTAFFVVGFHPGSVRSARRFAWPALVFNGHDQFEALRRAGRFERLQEKIRRRELALDGSLNANLSSFGEGSEARQYAGRPVPGDWQCPFSPR